MSGLKGIVRTMSSLTSECRPYKTHSLSRLFTQPLLTRNLKAFSQLSDRAKTYIVKEHSDPKSKYIEEDIIKMLDSLVDTIFVVFTDFQQHSNGHKWCPSPSLDTFISGRLRSGFMQSLLLVGEKHLASQSSCTYRINEDDLLINKPNFENYLGQIYATD